MFFHVKERELPVQLLKEFKTEKTDSGINRNPFFITARLAVNQSENHNEQRDGFAKTDNGNVLTETFTGFCKCI